MTAFYFKWKHEKLAVVIKLCGIYWPQMWPFILIASLIDLLVSLNYAHTKVLAQQRWGRNCQSRPWGTNEKGQLHQSNTQDGVWELIAGLAEDWINDDKHFPKLSLRNRLLLRWTKSQPTWQKLHGWCNAEIINNLRDNSLLCTIVSSNLHSPQGAKKCFKFLESQTGHMWHYIK